ncbi:AMP-binding protein [Streptomyces malaysiensis]|uniref:AMP-binding protein n=1 Tax=Streptomyces malaysiensis subsp. samsunensis TaxID=459658 RepID=A0A9X2M566_STRMQ|nr:AMP-binding protein [Streptomyces samsunensis]MCQ8835582.1 AMP-binding protein [Streptomyces samsunensis]
MLSDHTLPTILAHWAERAAEREFLQFGDEPACTFLDMEFTTNRVARSLRGYGVQTGDRVAMLLPNRIEVVHTWFGAAKLGAIEVPVNIELKGKLLAHVLSNSGAGVLVCDVSLLEQRVEIINVIPDLHTVVIVGGSPEQARAAGLTVRRVVPFAELLTADSTPVRSDVRHTDPMAILYTSGTTGPAKGVVLSHQQYFLWVQLYARSLGLTREDSYFSPLPLFHADAQLWGVYFPLVFGTKGTFQQRFSVSRFWPQVRASGATATNLLGAMAQLLWKAPATADDTEHSLRIAQALPMIPFKREFERRFGLQLVTAYGQTETNWVSYDTTRESRPGSAGKVASEHFEVRIVDELDEPLPPGATGEIVVRPKHAWSISLGYHAMPEETHRAWRNLWFHTGDAGYLDEDGWLYFVDRIKDVIRRRGENISAFELESVVNDHPAVRECAAIAVSSELSEDDVMLIAVAEPGVALDAAELLAYCRRQLPKYMVPRYLEIVREPLPRTPTEKISKPDLRRRGLTPATWDTERGEVAEGGAVR